MKYCKFISQVKSSQVKSSQVKSSAKIVSLINNSFKIFLIALLFILLFSISCKPKQNPNEGGSHSRAELVGTWKSTYSKNEYILNIDSEGNLIFNCDLRNDDGWHYNYAGKLADTFDYPYTIELTFTASSLSPTSCKGYEADWFNKGISELTPKSKIGKFTFNDASTLTVPIGLIGASSIFKEVYWFDDNRNIIQILNFTKQ